MKGPDQGFTHQGLEVLQGGVADYVQQLVHQAVAELVQRRLGRMGADVFELEGLRLVSGEAVV